MKMALASLFSDWVRVEGAQGHITARKGEAKVLHMNLMRWLASDTVIS